MNVKLYTGLIAAFGLFADVGAAQAMSGALQAGDAGHAEARNAEAGHAEEGHKHAGFASDRLHVRVDGNEDGGDIILIPGLSSSPEIWQRTVAHLEGGWRVHRIHIQGFAGAAPKANATGPVAAPVAEEIARYITENRLDRPVVIGHSMGGTIGMMLAARHPDLVGKLMVVDMIPFMGAMFGPPGATADSVAPIADQIFQAMANASRADYLASAEATVSGMVNDPEGRALALAHLRTSDQQVSAASYRELVTTDLRPELAKITAPTEVVYVKFNDVRMTPEITDMVYRTSYATLPNVITRRIDDAAHFVFLDQPAAFHEQVDAFLAR